MATRCLRLWSCKQIIQSHRQFSHGDRKNKVNRPAIKHVYVVVQERAISLRESIFVGDLVGGFN